jgi:hypothetical protein
MAGPFVSAQKNGRILSTTIGLQLSFEKQSLAGLAHNSCQRELSKGLSSTMGWF